MRLNAAVSVAIAPAVSAPPRPAELLGVADTAVYLRVPQPRGRRGDDDRGDSVLAVLTNDAVRLPCGLVLGFGSAERSLRRIGPLPADPAMVGNGCVQWHSSVGLIMIYAVRSWAPPALPRSTDLAAGLPGGLAQLRSAIDGIDIGIEVEQLAELAAAGADPGYEPVATAAVLGLLGRGDGLTPSGDDVLAGFLVGARALGLDVSGVAAAVRTHAPARTTALSSQLLRNADAGEAIREVVAVLAALPNPVALTTALAALLRVGHTSGAALACGLVLAGQLALTPAGGGR